MADVTVSLAVDGKQVKTGLDAARRDVQKFAKGTQKDLAASGAGRMTAIGRGMGSAIAGLAVGAKIGSVVNEYARLADLSSRLGVSAESMQRVGIAAEQAGTDAETAARALTLLNRALDDPENKKAASAFEDLGLSISELKAADAFSQIRMLSAAFQKAQSTGTGFADIMGLLGKSGAELIPMLRMTAAEMDNVASTNVVSDEQIAQIAKLDDRIMEIQRRLSIGLAKGAAGSVSLLDKATENLGGLALGAGEFTSNLMAGNGFMKSLDSGFIKVADLAEQSAQESKDAADEAEREAEARKNALNSMEGAAKASKKVTDEKKKTGTDTNGDGFTSKREQRVYDLAQKRGQRRADSVKGFSRISAGLANFGGLAELKEMNAMQENMGFGSVGLRWKGVKSTDPIGTIAARNVPDGKGGIERLVTSQDKLYNLIEQRLTVD